MVNISSKEPTKRSATATGRIYISRIAYDLITIPGTTEACTPSISTPAVEKAKSKGDVLTVAQLAAIMGCKRTSDLIPLCHPLQLNHIAVKLYPEEAPPPTLDDSHPAGHAHPRYWIKCEATVTCEGKTGVEMEALTGVSVGLLTVWDMLKAIAGKDMIIGDIVVQKKQGGKSGGFVRSEPL